MTVKSLGSIIFVHNEIYIVEDDTPQDILAEMQMSAGGTHIVYEAEIITPYITLDSQEDSWITEADKEILETMWRQLGSTWTLTYNDDTTDTVRLARERDLIFTPLYEGGCEYYRVIIPLAKTI